MSAEVHIVVRKGESPYLVEVVPDLSQIRGVPTAVWVWRFPPPGNTSRKLDDLAMSLWKYLASYHLQDCFDDVLLRVCRTMGITAEVPHWRPPQDQEGT